MNEPRSRPVSRVARVLDAGLRLYQRSSSRRLPRCRFTPTCSQYAREAIATHGAGAGTWLALRRLARCHPLGGHGFDPVPDVSDRGRPHLHRPHLHRPHRLRGADPC